MELAFVGEIGGRGLQFERARGERGLSGGKPMAQLIQRSDDLIVGGFISQSDALAGKKSEEEIFIHGW